MLHSVVSRLQWVKSTLAHTSFFAARSLLSVSWGLMAGPGLGLGSPPPSYTLSLRRMPGSPGSRHFTDLLSDTTAMHFKRTMKLLECWIRLCTVCTKNKAASRVARKIWFRISKNSAKFYICYGYGRLRKFSDGKFTKFLQIYIKYFSKFHWNANFTAKKKWRNFDKKPQNFLLK